MKLCTSLSFSALFLALVRNSEATCIPSETNICMSIDIFASETGLYNLDRGGYEEISGPSPTITAKIGQTLVFDQTHPSNWYHAVGFAYAPDGAHGDDWGAEENPEVEAAGELQYLINDEVPTCADAGDTGLDCYEPEFFYPRGDWIGKKYTANLTITEAMAAASNGGVIYYFCHIHSKMSGKIIIKNADGSDYVSSSTEIPLYEPVVNDAFDTECGTSEVSEYAAGAANECNIDFFSGSVDTSFEKCLKAIDCQMHWEMYSETIPDENDKLALFMQQMIPHHVNAVNMAKLALKQSTQEELDAIEDSEDILWDIINTQNYQIHQFRNYLNSKSKLVVDSVLVPPTASRNAKDEDMETSKDETSNDTSSGNARRAMTELFVLFAGIASLLAAIM